MQYFMKGFLLTVFMLGLGVLAYAQAPVGSMPVSNQNVNVAPGGSSFDSNTLPAMSDRVFDTENDAVDFEEGSLYWKGRTFNLGNNRVMRARFERYLAGPEISENQASYMETMRQIEQGLSLIDENLDLRSSDEAKKSLFEAWKLLFQAGGNQYDGGNSLIIANLVNNAWRVQKEQRVSVIYEEELKNQQRKLEDTISQEVFWQEKKLERAVKEAQKNKTNAPIAMSEGQAALTNRMEEMTTVKGLIASLATQTASSAMELKLQFQSQMVQFLVQRRYQHVIIASQFYNLIFKGSHQGLEVGKEQLSEFLPNSDLKPTVGFLESVAREAIADTKTGMSAVENAYENGELYGAMERLQETFFLGEYVPDVLVYPETKKKSLLDLFRQQRELAKLMDFKNYTQAEALVQEMASAASDFPASSILTLTSTAKRASNLAVLKAKQAIATGAFEKAEAAIQEATKFWPLNPEVMEFSENVADQVDMGAQGVRIFDELYDSNDFRKIFDRKAEFAAALLQDKARSEQLKEVIDKLAKVDFLLAQVKEAMAQNNPYFAWETILQAESIYPDDLELQRAKADISVRASEFARNLDEAERAEADDQYGMALMRYLDAKEVYPASRNARLGLERSAKALLDAM